MIDYSDYSASSTAEIDLRLLAGNLATARSRADRAAVIAVVKANAYGHGATEVARHLEQSGIEAFGVATLAEAAELREAGIKKPIICLFGIFPEDAAAAIRLNLEPVVYEEHAVAALAREAHRTGTNVKLHLDVDTGMSRVGVTPEEAPQIARLIARQPGLQLAGIMTHYAEADLADSEFTGNQAATLSRTINELASAGIDFPLKHQANSAATLSGLIAPGNTIRPGLLLYGLYPGRDCANLGGLQPILTWKSRILYLKRVPAGTSISYGRTFTTARSSLIATVPVGYADGYSRALSNRGQMLVGGQKAPIVGRVCMDLTMIDVTDIPGVSIGDEVVILGQSGNQQITADEIASLTGTINYEVLTSIGSRVRRVYLRD